MGNAIKYFLEEVASNIWTIVSNHEDFTTIVLHLMNFYNISNYKRMYIHISMNTHSTKKTNQSIMYCLWGHTRWISPG